MRADAPLVPPDKKRIPRRNVISEAGAPEVVVALTPKDRSNPASGSSEASHLNEHVHNRLCGESRDSSAPKCSMCPMSAAGWLVARCWTGTNFTESFDVTRDN
jgi:hypothetical protein